MQEKRFRNWLRTDLKKESVDARVSICKRVEKNEGDLDDHWDADGLAGLIDRLTYSKEDERNKEPPKHKVQIDGKIYDGTVTLKAAVVSYRKFRRSDDAPGQPDATVAGALADTDVSGLADELLYDATDLRKVTKLLDDKRQVIFQGPPGTGKTYAARELARFFAGSKERVTLVQFHPSYAYEDFVQGYRPTLRNGQAGFTLRDGPLVTAAENARVEPDARHFLIIDEINRGNLAKVFGELYFLLEYRDEGIAAVRRRGRRSVQSAREPLHHRHDEHRRPLDRADRSGAATTLPLRRVPSRQAACQGAA